MYQKAGAAVSTGAVGGLAATGANILWTVLAAFAFIAVGAALSRIAPRFGHNKHQD